VSDPPAAPGGAIVLGAGLAGLVAALRLAEQGLDVEVHEAADRTGGKAGSDLLGDRAVEPYWSDHGYHVVQAWYTNTWALLDELGVEGDVTRRQWFLRLRLDRLARLDRGGWKLFVQRRLAGISARSALIAVDLVATDEAELVDLTLAEFIAGRDYLGDADGAELRLISLKALGLPPERASALTFRTNMRLLMPVMWKANWNATDGSMQERLVEPLRRRAEAAGARIHTGSRVTAVDATGADGTFRVTGLTVGDGRHVDVGDRDVVLATPFDVAAGLLDPHLDRVPATLRGLDPKLDRLASAQLVGLDVHLRDRLKGFPRKSHVILDGSPHHLTALDLRDLWTSGLPGRGTVLQVIAADVDATGRSDDEVVDAILDDLFAFFPWLDRERDVLGVVRHLNADARLFLNTAGSEPFRPRSDEYHGANVLVAGDWCLTPISLACMEGAVVSGAQAAGCTLTRAGRPAPEVSVPDDEPSRRARRWFRVLRPVVATGGRVVDALRRRSRDAPPPPARGGPAGP
jgi:phytoene dehydrogenase-like protein